MEQQEIERAQVEVVFCLGGGELESEPWAGYAYWYRGIPDWLESRDFPERVTCPNCGDPDIEIDFCPRCEGAGKIWVEYRTVCIYAEPPKALCVHPEDDNPECWCIACKGTGELSEAYAGHRKSLATDEWTLVGHWTTSGEAQCWCSGEGEADKDCPVCEGDGLVVLGSGWGEAVYSKLQGE